MRLRFLPLLFIAGLLGLTLLWVVRENPGTLWSVLGAAGALAAWDILLLVRGEAFTAKIAIHKHHYIQASAQASVLAYWGWYWPDVYAFLPLLLAQLLFGFAFQMLLFWSRGTPYPMGFGVFPVVFSINLFLWFKPEWFGFQFVLVALGLQRERILSLGT